MAKATVAVANKDKTLHPPYFEMISEAILTMKERRGSSLQAIAKFIEGKYKKLLPSKFKKIVSVQLKKFVKSKRLVKFKNSFKVSSAENQKKTKGGNYKAEKTKLANKIAEKRVMKTKRLSQVKTPEKKKYPWTPMKRMGSKPIASSRPSKKPRK